MKEPKPRNIIPKPCFNRLSCVLAGRIIFDATILPLALVKEAYLGNIERRADADTFNSILPGGGIVCRLQPEAGRNLSGGKAENGEHAD